MVRHDAVALPHATFTADALAFVVRASEGYSRRASNPCLGALVVTSFNRMGLSLRCCERRHSAQRCAQGRHAEDYLLLDGDVYLFTGRNPRRAKVLYFDGTGLCLLAKRLERGRFARLWTCGEGAIALTLSELALFLEGSELVGRKTLVPPTFEQKELAVEVRK